MESQNNGLKPGGNGNWEEILKKSSNSDEICESDIEQTEIFFFKLTNFYNNNDKVPFQIKFKSQVICCGDGSAILPFYYPKFTRNGLKSALLVGFA